jgi:hypothetical protein
MGDMDERVQAEIAKLPPAQRAAAQAEHDEFRQLRESLAGLSQEERRAKMQDYFQQNGDRGEQRQLDRDSRMTPEQRVQRANRYAQRRQEIRSGGNQ